MNHKLAIDILSKKVIDWYKEVEECSIEKEDPRCMAREKELRENCQELNHSINHLINQGTKG